MAQHRSDVRGETERPAQDAGRSPDDTDALDPRMMATRVEGSPRRPAAPGATNSSGKGSESPSDASPAESPSSGSDGSQAGSRGGSKGGSKAGTSFDTLVGQLAIERGLATPEEVKHCQTLASGSDAPAARSLAQLLVQNEYVTERQLARLRQIVEEERSGQQIPGFRVESKLGAGAMAKVFKARQVSLDRPVAIKVLPKKFSTNPQFIERFYNEGRAAAQLNHPNIVQAFDVGRAGDLYYFVMEYVEGRTVHDDIVARKRYPENDAIEIVMQVAEALQHAHERGLVHRDVKPKNIMITSSGSVKLADMGLARAISDKEAAEAEAGKAFGTPYYISPEQIRGEKDIGAPADIYSLGATMYHMVTGQVPFEGKNPSSVMSKHLKAPLVAPDHVNPKLSNGVGEVIEMMMAKKVADRYQSCKDLLIDLRAVRNGEAPPLAHRELVASDTLAAMASAEESAAAGEIAVDTSRPAPLTLGEQVRAPMFIFLSVLFLLSLVANILFAVN